MFMRTERLFLRPVFPEDWRGIYRGIADFGVVSMLARAPWPYSEEDAQQFCADSQAGKENRFVITLPGRAGASVIGMIGFGVRENGSGQELGYWIARDWHGRGFATEAVKGVVQVAQALGIAVLEAGHYLDNPASGKVLRKAGFVPTGDLEPTICMARGGETLMARRYALPLGINGEDACPEACPAAA